MTCEINEPIVTPTDTQLLIEASGSRDGIERYRRNVASRPSTELPPGQVAMKQAIEPVAAAVVQWVADVKAGAGRRGAEKAKWLEVLDPEVYAFIAVQLMLNNAGESMSSLASAIGLAIQDEMDVQAFKDHAPGLYSWLLEKLKTKNNRWYRRRMFQITSKRVKTPETPESLGWDREMRAGIGMIMIELVIEATGFFEVVLESEVIPCRNGDRIKQNNKIQPTAELLEWTANAHGVCELMRPIFPPMVVKPNDWVSPIEGGYLSGRMALDLVKGGNINYLNDAHQTGRLDTVLRAVNTLQSTPWKINDRVLAVANDLWSNQAGNTEDLAGLPGRNKMPKPAKPAGYEADPEKFPHLHPEEFKGWKSKAKEAYEHNESIKRMNTILETDMKLRVANEFVAHPAIYFPCQLDFRGRIYPVVNGLNPQGDDFCRGLLTFAEGVAIDNDAAKWLAIHGANCWAVKDENGIGLDKKTYTERYQWVIEHTAQIVRTAEDPSNFLWWTSADAPWQFLAFCFEWAQWLIVGNGFVSHLPVSADGSCNGLQHYAALLRDQDAGVTVNLVPGEKPNDVYAVVSSKANQLLASDAVEGDFTAEARLLQGKIDRSVVKRAVMTTPYGVSKYGIRKQLKVDQQEIFKAIEKKMQNKVATYLSNLIVRAIGDSVKGAKQGMDFLQELAKSASKADLPVIWTTPDGFPVQQRYEKFKMIRIRTELSGGTNVKTRGVSIGESTGKLDSKAQTRGIGPNFIHSLDASHLRMVINGLADLGITHFAAIHDSFGVHAAHFETMQQVVRETFVAMHQEPLLEILRSEVAALCPEGTELPEVPEMGSLRLGEVLDSDYFFA